MPVAGIRYNNPFNISLPRSGYFGGSVVGLQGQPGYAAFPDMATGYAAGAQRLSDYVSGNTSYGRLNTLSTLGPVYATDPNWAAGVSQASGIPLNQVIDPGNTAQMTQLQGGILQQELGGSTGLQLSQQFGNPSQIATGPIDSSAGFNVTTPSDQQFATFNQRFDAAFPNMPQTATTDPSIFDPTAFSQVTTGSQPTDLGTTTVAQAAASGGGMAAADQTASQVDANAIAGATSGTGGNISGTGTGTPVQIGPQPGLTALVSSAVTSVESAFGAEAQKILSSAVEAVTNYFGITGNLFVRFGLIVLGVVVIAVALSKLMGGPNLKDVAAAAASAARAA